MVDVLYDYQLAVALSNETSADGKLAEQEYKYTHAVFAKHKITEDEFNLSIAHYARDPKVMLEITKKVSDRLTEEVQKSQDEAAKQEQERFAAQTDTVIVWENRGGTILSANGRNTFEQTIAGKRIPKCDRLLLGYSASWVYREGSKNGSVVMTVTFDNDSTCVTTDNIREYERSQGMSVNVPKERKVKEVKVQFYQSAWWKKYPQIMSLTDLSLWCIQFSDK